MRKILFVLGLFFIVSCSNSGEIEYVEDHGSIESEKAEFGIDTSNYIVENFTVKRGDFFGSILNRIGVSANEVYNISQASKNVFDVRKIKLGDDYRILREKDSLKTPAFMIYDQDNLTSVVISLKDSLYAKEYTKQLERNLKVGRATISTSLWNDVQKAGIPALMALKLSDVYDCTIDFFGLQNGDSFIVLYDELTYNGEYMGLGDIYMAEFTHVGKVYKAYRFAQGQAKSQFWNEEGGSMKKAFLKAPLNFTRISSRFTYARRHPILKIVRPHTGVDYAAPSGTPVVALGEGVVIHRGWAGGGGHTVKIKHPGNYVTSYMHLRGYAKGLKKGSRVAQGELIGYVGSTGLSTGPHLDFRVYKNGKPIDPLKMESPSVEPISKEYMAEFDTKKEHYYKQMDSLKVAVHIENYYQMVGAEFEN